MPTPQSLPPWMLQLMGLRPGDEDVIPVHLHLFRVHLPNYYGKEKVHRRRGERGRGAKSVFANLEFGKKCFLVALGSLF